jgi:preprotein translocase subunit SecE
MIVPIVNYVLLYLLAFGHSPARVVSPVKSSEAAKPKREGLRRLSIAIAVFVTVLSSFLIGGSLIPQSNSPVVLLPVLFFSVIIGAVCWALVRLVVWTIDGFRSQKVEVPEDLDK